MLDVQGLTVCYGRRRVLEDLSLRLERGTVTAILGPNGCGKSTLLKAVSGLIPRKTGTIRIDGADASHLRPRETALRIAYLAQGQDTPDMTVEQMVLHGRFPYLTYPCGYTEADRQAAAATMARLGISELARRPLHTLSGGMRQTAYLAMALVRDTPYILLDEPTTYLDVGHQGAFMRLLRQVAAEGRGVVAVLHDLPLALTFSDRVILMADGTLQDEGTPREIVRRGGIEKIFGVRVVEGEDGFTCRF